jgi:hypothetical protein
MEYPPRDDGSFAVSRGPAAWLSMRVASWFLPCSPSPPSSRDQRRCKKHRPKRSDRQAEAAAVDALDDPQGQSSRLKWVPLRGLMLLCLIEPEPCLGELAFGEGKDLGGPDFEDVGDACVVIEGAVAHVEPPVALVLI